MTPREYWIMTEVFVYIHGGDECSDSRCPHCKFISETFPDRRFVRDLFSTMRSFLLEWNSEPTLRPCSFLKTYKSGWMHWRYRGDIFRRRGSAFRGAYILGARDE